MTAEELTTFCRKIDTRPMTDEETKTFITLAFADMNGAKFEEAEKMWVFAAAKKRAEAIGLNPTDPALLFLCYYFNAIGLVVLAIHYVRERVGDGPMNMEMLGDIWPNGFWTEQAVHAAWEFQKTAKGNYVDQMLSERLDVA